MEIGSDSEQFSYGKYAPDLEKFSYRINIGFDLEQFSYPNNRVIFQMKIGYNAEKFSMENGL